MLNAVVAAATIFACSFVLVKAAGSPPNGVGPSPLSLILEHLPATLGLLALSTLLALGVGAALVSLTDRARGRLAKILLAGIAIGLRCVPFFWLALAAQLMVTIRLGTWYFGGEKSNHASPANYLLQLVVSGCLLALVQIPIVVQAFIAAAARSNSRNGLARVFSALEALAMRLPEVLAACLMTEIVLVWPGEGRLFLSATQVPWPALAIGVVLLTAVLTLILRVILRLAAPALRLRGELKNG